MRARVVIGANFGDEGKGLVTDYLCATQGAGMVVRFNGGAQAGHTVVTPDGKRHVFSHFGSGTLAGVPTFLSQFFICNPIMFFPELETLINMGVAPEIYAHPSALVTTFADMWINQRKEEARGDKRHGSVGVGVSETVARSEVPQLKITVSDLWNGADLRPRLREIAGKYAQFRSGKQIDDPEPKIEAFIKRCQKFAEIVEPLGISQCKDPVFEGAQGLLLDQNNKEYFPHLTRSNTGMQNVAVLCQQAGIKDIDPYYVTRSYLTRHGAGPLPGEDPKLSYADDTNADHPYQGKLRFAPLDFHTLYQRMAKDMTPHKLKHARLVMTHCDQHEHRRISSASILFHGPTRADATAKNSMVAA